jgi:LmbE family N-acetylglucosaminyl deacetylase
VAQISFEKAQGWSIMSKSNFSRDKVVKNRPIPRLQLFTLVLVAAIVVIPFSRSFGFKQVKQDHLVLMCVSAHPDDEDGATLAYYTHVKNIKAYSVFYTRGEGGQNVTGPELYKELGELRTEETLAASKILGTQVYFLNFPDFGFSKTAKETFRMWGGKDAVLSRIVYMIRALKPDVIITHHDTITTLPYRQHGNHQAVGITIYEAFTKAADPSYHPEQLRHGLKPWQVKKLYFRVLRESKLNQDSLVTIPVDTKYGSETIQQIAWDALRKHRTQGMENRDFKNVPAIFRQAVYQLIRSDRKYPYNPHDLFSGIQPSERRMNSIPKKYTADLKPLSMYVSPEYSLLKQSADGSRQKVNYVIDTYNRTRMRLPITLYVYFGRHNILIKRYVLPDSERYHLNVPLELPRNNYKKDSLTIAALPHPRRGVPGLRFQRAVVYLKRVPASFASTDYIGLVNTYDNTLQQTFDAFGIKYQILDSTNLASEDLSKFTTIVLDIRGYLYRHDLVRYNDRILDYVENGGNVVCFYNRPPEWDGHNFAPYPIDITGERVTEENQPVTILDPASRLFHYPNQIVATDWNGWVQERNIYLPDGDTTKTSANYERLLAMSDEDESEPSTSLLWAKYGSGTYTYCSLALYRQIKILNDGGMKLLFNLISQSRNNK